MMRSRLLAGILAFLCIGAVAAAQSVEGPTFDEFNALEQRVAALEEEVFAAAEPEPSPSPSHHPSPEPSPEAPSPESPSEFDRVLSGQIAGATVPAGETWKIEGLVESTANVVVLGTLLMRPGATLRFVGVNEAAFVGGGMDPVASDIGLWVMGDGVLDAQGTPKVPWNRTGTHPTWRATDELVVTPTAAGEWEPQHFRPFTMGSPVPRARADLPAAEVLNLTRNVVIEGTPTGRTHIFIRSTRPSTIKYALIRHVGPEKGDNRILGRWGLHFHHSGNGSVGSIVQGVVVRDAGSHAFVPHASHGITLRYNIAFNVRDTAYWWDSDVPTDATNNSLWEFNVAAAVGGGEPRNAGFRLGDGFGNVARGNVAVGVYGGSRATGYHWPAGSPWVFDDNVSHNNKFTGHSVWTNSGETFTINRLISYRNGQYGNTHGAYKNSFVYNDSLFALNGWRSVAQLARSPSSFQSRYDGGRLEGVFLGGGGHLSPGQPWLIRDVVGITRVDIDEGDGDPSLYDFVRCGLEPSHFNIITMHPDSRIRVQRADGTAFQITSAGVQTIPAFA